MISILGPWKYGYAFDVHTIRSEYLGEDQYGHPQFNTVRSPIGQCLYDLKYGQKFSSIKDIMDIISSDSDFRKFIEKMNIIIPTPPSNKHRNLQPVILVAQEIARVFKKELRQDIFSSSNCEEIKNIDTNEKYERIRQSLNLQGQLEMSKHILLFDDVFDSGATLMAMTNIMIEKGYTKISIFTLTKTRMSN